MQFWEGKGWAAERKFGYERWVGWSPVWKERSTLAVVHENIDNKHSFLQENSKCAAPEVERLGHREKICFPEIFSLCDPENIGCFKINANHSHKRNTKYYRNTRKNIALKYCKYCWKWCPSAWQRFIRLKNTFFNILLSILFTSSVICAFNSLVVTVPVLNTLSLWWPHKWKSKGNTSGLCGGHKPVKINRSAKSDWRNCMVSCVVCGCALSCWNQALTSPCSRREMKSVIHCDVEYENRPYVRKYERVFFCRNI